MLSSKSKNIEFQIDIEKNREVIHYPTLKTVLLVEKTLQNSDKPLNKNQIKDKLGVKIMHQTLTIILTYLEERGMIVRAREGYVWTYNPSKKLLKAIKEGYEV
ncbi:MAG TPA: hypothetical protein VJB05_03745 [archaeon]|nr:hypothetical protein [archaeon]